MTPFFVDNFFLQRHHTLSSKKLQLADKIEQELRKKETNWKLLIKHARGIEVLQNEVEDIAETKNELNMVICLQAVWIMRPELRIRGFFRNELIQTIIITTLCHNSF